MYEKIIMNDISILHVYAILLKMRFSILENINETQIEYLARQSNTQFEFYERVYEIILRRWFYKCEVSLV